MTLLEIQSLNFKFRNEAVLKDISLEADTGDFIGVLGPNGSGKTTLLRCISGVLEPDSGQVFLEGKLLQKYSSWEIARIISVVPQGIEAGFEFSAAEFVTMGRIPYLRPFRGETPKDLAVVSWAMEVTGTKSLAERNFRELSGGERQRVVIAQALAQQPRLLLLDEPASYLDIGQVTEMFDLMLRLKCQLNLGIIVVLHDLNLAARYCDYLILLSEGRVFAQGVPSDVLTPDNIRQVYGAEVEVLQFRGREYVVPLAVGDRRGVHNE